MQEKNKTWKEIKQTKQHTRQEGKQTNKARQD